MTQTDKRSYVFRLDQKQEIKAHLSEKGWVVIKNIATTKECTEIINLQWDFLEQLGTGLKRDSPETWYQAGRWPGRISTGQVLAPYVGHCEAVWKARCISKVRDLFALLWETRDLKVAFDTFNVTRPYTLASNRAKGIAPHIDQNPNTKPNFVCYQGLLNLRPLGEDDGGTLLYTGSHLKFQNYGKYAKGNSDWVVIGGKDKTECIEKMVCPNLDPGDFLVWDGRTIHGVGPPTKGKKDPKGSKYFRRSVVYISMMPTQNISKEILEKRKRLFQEGVTTNHWADNTKPKNMRPRYPRKISYQIKEYKKVKLDTEGRSLV